VLILGYKIKTKYASSVSQLRNVLRDTGLYSSAAPSKSHTRYTVATIKAFVFSHGRAQNSIGAQNSVQAHQGLLQPEHKADHFQSCSACFVYASINVYTHIQIYLFFSPSVSHV
jgi:hypothetical protein